MIGRIAVRRLWGLVLVGALACGGGQGGAGSPSPAPLDPTGTWTGNTMVQGQSMGFSLAVTGDPGAYTGVLTSSGDIPPIPLDRVVVEDTTVTLYGNLMGEGVVLTLEMEGDAFTGRWSAAGDSGTMTGSRSRE